MSEHEIIKGTKKMNTIDSIVNDLHKLGIHNGDTLLVHSSLSSMGWVCGGAHAVIIALLKVVGDEGTLIMPSHSGDNTDPGQWSNPPVPADWIEQIVKNMPAFDVHMSPTRGMGKIAELFRTIPQATRSDHPQTSFSAVGKYADIVTDSHPLTPQFGIESPLGKMFHLNAKNLLLGVGYDCCTSFHLAETMNDKMPMKQTGSAIFENGGRVWKWFEDFDYDSDRDFEKIGEEFDKTGRVTNGIVGNATCKLFDLKEGVLFANDWIKAYRFIECDQ